LHRLTPAVAPLLAIAGFLFDIAAYYPGQMTFDAAYTWWQARGGESTDIHSPTLTQLWRILETLWHGPGPVFVLHLLLFWGGLALIALGLRLRPPAAMALMLLLGLAPILLILRAHVWTDVGLLGALLVVTGALAFYMRTLHWRWLLLALLIGFYALGLRHNALPALLPLMVFAVWLSPTAGKTPPTWRRTTLFSILLVAVMLAGVQAINARVDRRVPLWPPLAVFDLSAISIAANQLLLPSYSVGHGMEITELAEAFRPWSVNSLLDNTRHGIHEPLAPWTDSELAGLRKAWLGAIVSHPGEYLRHRLAVTAALFGTQSSDVPSTLTFVDAEIQYRDNPAIAPNTSALHCVLMQAAQTLRYTPVLAAWPYLLLGVVAAPIAWRRRAQPSAKIALVMLVSAALYALPLIVIVPSAERRYLLWSCAAALVALVLALAREPPRTIARGSGVKSGGAPMRSRNRE